MAEKALSLEVEHLLTSVLPFNPEVDEAEASDIGCSEGKSVRGKLDKYGRGEKTSEGDGSRYDGRKPGWWHRRSARRMTKPQRFALNRIENEGYVVRGISRPGETLDLERIFATPLRCRGNTDGEVRLSGGGRRELDVAPCTKEEESGGCGTGYKVWVEIGFGDGSNLLTLSRIYPHLRLLGAEVCHSGVGAAARRVDAAVSDGKYWNGERLYRKKEEMGSQAEGTNAKELAGGQVVAYDVLPEDDDYGDAASVSHRIKPYDNVRLYPGDGCKLLRSLPLSSISIVLLTFPDPFGKDHHKRWRIVQDDTMASIERVLKPGGEGYFYLATDSDDVVTWTTEVVERRTLAHSEVENDGKGGSRNIRNNSLWEKVHPPQRETWLPVVSRYEAKGWEEGRTTKVRCWRYLGC